MDIHISEIGNLLLANRGPLADDFWGWLRPGVNPTTKSANKFMLACILDYQMRAETAWNNAGRLADEILKDPDLLWQTVTSVSIAEWNSKWREYSLHRFPKGHERVWTIGKQIVQRYEGNVIQIWDGQSIDAAMYRLNSLGVGEQISRMIAGALVDTGQLSGRGDVKVDIHVSRVLGRAMRGRQYDQPADVLSVTRQMNPDNPWLLDRPLFTIGKQFCTANNPQCGSCFLQSACVHASSRCQD